MLTIRFNRTGKKNRVSYRLVLQEKTKAPGKRHIEILGSHDPHSKTTILRKDRIEHWLKEGVQCSQVVHNLLVREGVLEGKIIPRKMPRPVVKEVPVEEVVEETPAVEEVAAEEAPVVEEVVVAEAEAPTEEVVAPPVEAPSAEPVEVAEAPIEEEKVA
jgi:small subunit ribosomal protein S16